MVSVSINRISKKYASVSALDDVCLTVDKGELFGLIGSDGAGKTTLFRILATLLKPDSGLAMVEGLDAVKDFKKLRCIIGYMPGRFSLYQDLTVEENLSFFATIFGTTIRENYELIRDIYIQIEPFKNRRAGALSGGMKQKLALCCALIHKPEVLILDEPTTGVDAVSRREFWEMLQKLREEGITIMVSTAYMDEARLCGRVALIQDGGILQVDDPETIIEGYDKKLLAVKARDMYGLILDLQQLDDAEDVFPSGEFIHYTAKSNAPDVKTIKEYLEAKGHDSVRVQHAKPGIEDCFMRLMMK